MRIENKKKFINKPAIFYIVSFLQNISYGTIGSLFVVYGLSIGLNAGQIGILFATERISSLIFEIPTGGFADKYGRKKSVLLSFAAVSLILLIWFFSQKFYILLVAAILWGISYTFQSGAEESLIVTSLKLEKDDQKRNKSFSRLSIFGNFGFFVGGLLGALLAFYQIKLIWLAGSFLSIAVFLLYLIFIEEKSSTADGSAIDSDSPVSISGLIKENVLVVLKNKIIFIFLIITFVHSFGYSFYSLGYPVFLKKIFEIPVWWFGFLGSLSALLGIMGAYFSDKLAKKKGFIFTLISFSVIISLSVIIFGLMKTLIFALIAFSIKEFMEAGHYPIYQSFLNKFLVPEKRATLLSINSAVGTLALALGELTAGLFLSIFYPGLTLIIGGLLLLFIPISFLKIKKIAPR